MDKKQNPIKAYLKAVAHKWGWLVGSVVGLLQTVSYAMGFTPNFHWWVGITIFVLCLFIAMYLAFRDVYIKLELTIEKPSTIKLQQRHIKFDDEEVIRGLENQMEKIHGHSDSGIRTECRDGVLLDDIMNHKCVRCWIPRNQIGGDVND